MYRFTLTPQPQTNLSSKKKTLYLHGCIYAHYHMWLANMWPERNSRRSYCACYQNSVGRTMWTVHTKQTPFQWFYSYNAVVVVVVAAFYLLCGMNIDCTRVKRTANSVDLALTGDKHTNEIFKWSSHTHRRWGEWVCLHVSILSHAVLIYELQNDEVKVQSPEYFPPVESNNNSTHTHIVRFAFSPSVCLFLWTDWVNSK